MKREHSGAEDPCSNPMARTFKFECEKRDSDALHYDYLKLGFLSADYAAPNPQREVVRTWVGVDGHTWCWCDDWKDCRRRAGGVVARYPVGWKDFKIRHVCSPTAIDWWSDTVNDRVVTTKVFGCCNETYEVWDYMKRDDVIAFVVRGGHTYQ